MIAMRDIFIIHKIIYMSTLYLIEYRLTISQVIEESISIEEAEVKTNQLEKDYIDRIDYWKKHQSYG